MLKLAAVGVVAALAGTTYVVAHANASAPVAAQATPAPTSSGHRVAHTARAEAFARVATTLAAVTSGVRAAAAAPALDCATVAHHMAEMAFAGQPMMPTWDAARMEQNYAHIAPHFAAACNQQHWSPEYMACILGADDMMSAGFDCAPYAPAQGGPPFSFTDDTGSAPADGFELQLATRTDPVPPTTDTSCAGVARHVAELTTPDTAAIAQLPADRRQAVQDGVARSLAAIPAQIEKACTDAGWTEERRRCLAAATTVGDMGGCI